MRHSFIQTVLRLHTRRGLTPAPAKARARRPYPRADRSPPRPRPPRGIGSSFVGTAAPVHAMHRRQRVRAPRIRPTTTTQHGKPKQHPSSSEPPLPGTTRPPEEPHGRAECRRSGCGAAGARHIAPHRTQPALARRPVPTLPSAGWHCLPPRAQQHPPPCALVGKQLAGANVKLSAVPPAHASRQNGAVSRRRRGGRPAPLPSPQSPHMVDWWGRSLAAGRQLAGCFHLLVRPFCFARPRQGQQHVASVQNSLLRG